MQILLSAIYTAKEYSKYKQTASKFPVFHLGASVFRHFLQTFLFGYNKFSEKQVLEHIDIPDGAAYN